MKDFFNYSKISPNSSPASLPWKEAFDLTSITDRLIVLTQTKGMRTG